MRHYTAQGHFSNIKWPGNRPENIDNHREESLNCLEKNMPVIGKNRGEGQKYWSI